MAGLPKRTHVPIQVNVVESVEFGRSAPAMHQALRALARMLVRNYHAEREGVANPPAARSSSTLTVLPQARPDEVDDAA